MLKKIIVATTVSALLAMSSSCFAGFGLPKVSVPKASTPTASKTTSETNKTAVDTTDITKKQTEILKYMNGALYAQLKSYMVVYEAMGSSNKELAQAANSLSNKGGNGAVKKVKSVIDKQAQQLSAEAKKAIAENKVQVQTLAAAMKTGKAYQQAAAVNYGFVALHTPGAIQEATSALKSVGSNPMAVNKINGAINTFKLGSQLASDSKKVNSEYNQVMDVLKSDFGVTDADLESAQAPDVENIANDCLDFVNK